ncbi:hypothetical protein Ddc_04274 [Ditylenchus destructor]|nr:hypothetical protein Ddc_04274 [Ditylenchus destructor]
MGSGIMMKNGSWEVEENSTGKETNNIEKRDVGLFGSGGCQPAADGQAQHTYKHGNTLSEKEKEHMRFRAVRAGCLKGLVH